MTSITIFFKDKIFFDHYPRFNNWLENRVDIDLMREFSILVAWYIIENNIQLDVISYHSPTMFVFLVFFLTRRGWLMLNTIMTITYTWVTNNL